MASSITFEIGKAGNAVEDQALPLASDGTEVLPPLFIFDLDGTLCTIEHRRTLLLDKTKGHRWRDFYAACDKDLPNQPVIDTLWMLHQAGAEVWVWSGRSDEVFDKTLAWFLTHLYRNGVSPIRSLRMRKEGNYTPDTDLKRKWLLGMAERDRKRLVATYDDRDRIVSMYRSHGVACYQVAPGDF